MKNARGKKLSGAKCRKRKLELEEEACKSSKVCQWCLTKAIVEAMKAMKNWLHTKEMIILRLHWLVMVMKSTRRVFRAVVRHNLR